MARRGEWTVKFKLFDEWRYDTIEASTPEQAAELFWLRLREAADPDTGLIWFRTTEGTAQFKLSAISGVVVQK